MQHLINYLLYTALLFNCGEAQLLDFELREALPFDTQLFSAENITYYLYNSSSPETYDNIHFCNASALNTSNKIVVVIHGWHEDRKTDWLQLVRKAFFARDSRYLVVEVDWSSYSKLDYAGARFASKRIGFTIGEFITYVVKLHSVPLEDFLIVGYSMGAHIAGFMGKKVFQLLGRRFKRIVGLDPAGPQYQYQTTADRLAPDDAEVVQVIYTNIAGLGYYGTCGSLNIHPNHGGPYQPGCYVEAVGRKKHVNAYDLCSSRRSILYFAEGIQASPKFLAHKCYYALLPNKRSCDLNELIEMCSLTVTDSGDFYLFTNSTSPYSIDPIY